MDEAILRAVNAWARDPTIAAIGVFLSSAWLPALVWTAVALYLAKKRRFIAIISIALALGATDLVNARVVKPLVARERPCRALSELELPRRCGAGKSFTSGHAAVATAFVVSASPVVPFGAAMFVPLAVLVAGSRTLLGQHYPSDLLAGALLGAAIGAGAHVLRRRLEMGLDARRSRRSAQRATRA